MSDAPIVGEVDLAQREPSILASARRVCRVDCFWTSVAHRGHSFGHSRSAVSFVKMPLLPVPDGHVIHGLIACIRSFYIDRSDPSVFGDDRPASRNDFACSLFYTVYRVSVDPRKSYCVASVRVPEILTQGFPEILAHRVPEILAGLS